MDVIKLVWKELLLYLIDSLTSWDCWPLLEECLVQVRVGVYLRYYQALAFPHCPEVYNSENQPTASRNNTGLALLCSHAPSNSNHYSQPFQYFLKLFIELASKGTCRCGLLA